MSYRVCYFVCFGEKSKSVFCVRFRQFSKTHVLYRCMFTHIQLWNSVIQRVDCMRFATFVHLAHLWEWGQCTVAAIVWGGAGRKQKTKETFEHMELTPKICSKEVVKQYFRVTDT